MHSKETQYLWDLFCFLLFPLFLNCLIILFYRQFDDVLVGFKYIYFLITEKQYPQVLDYIALVISFCLTFICILLNPFRKQSNRYGYAKFATKKDIQDMGLFAKEGIVIGKFGVKVKNENKPIQKQKWNKGTYLRLNEPLSTIVLAPPGTGKSAGIAVPTLLLNKRSMIVLDVKGELYQKTSLERSKFSKILKFSPNSEDSCSWNPLAKEALPKEWRHQVVVVDRISSALYRTEKFDHFVESGRKIFKFFALALIHQKGGTSIPEILRASRNAEIGDSKANIEYFKNLESLPDDLKGIASQMLMTSDDQWSGEFGSFALRLEPFSDPVIEKNITSNDFTFKEIREKCTTLYVIIESADIERLQALIRLFFESGAVEYLSTPKGEKEQYITFLMDEFIRLGKLDEVLKMPALSRGQGVNVVLIAQDYGQIDDLYGKGGSDMIDGTTALKIILPQNNFNTAKRTSEAIGKKTEIKESLSKQKNQKFLEHKESISKSEEGLYLLTPQDLMDMKFGNCIIQYQFFGAKPIKAKLALNFKIEELQQKIGCIENN